jgi:hypothetical protein
MQAIGDGGDDAEVAAATLQCPEQVWMLVGARRDQLAIRRDDVVGEGVVAGQTMLSHEPADAPAEGETGDARRRDETTGGRETMCLSLAIELRPGESSLCGRCSRADVDCDALHR